ncbi:MAG: helix-turn-helix transcriptional regulator [Proteobacteria bacterium]|nr:helix-turn-helix transcriptional regulator [Pseudomonadota bacterium]
MSSNEWPTPTEMVVMRILQGKPGGAYGLEIVAASNERVKRGSVYVLLGRLEEKGFVRVLKTRPEPGYDGPPRPQYQLTAEGTRVMTAAEAIGMSFSVGRA